MVKCYNNLVIQMKPKILLLSSLFFIIDFITKLVVDFKLELMSSIKIINKFFYLTKVYNYGASWSFLSGYQFILIIITILMLVILYFYQKKFKENKRNMLAFSLLYGGIFGNLINRVFFGYVIDFLDFKIFSYDFPVFNFADICIVMGIFLIIIAIWKKEDEFEINRRR